MSVERGAQGSAAPWLRGAWATGHDNCARKRCLRRRRLTLAEGALTLSSNTPPVHRRQAVNWRGFVDLETCPTESRYSSTGRTRTTVRGRRYHSDVRFRSLCHVADLIAEPIRDHTKDESLDSLKRLAYT